MDSQAHSGYRLQQPQQREMKNAYEQQLQLHPLDVSEMTTDNDDILYLLSSFFEEDGGKRTEEDVCSIASLNGDLPNDFLSPVQL